MSEQLTIEVAEDGAGPERVDALAGYLRDELLQLDVDDVTRAPGGPAPADARSWDVAAIGALLVTLGGAATNLNEIVTVVRGWLSRGGGTRRSVKITIDGDVLELSEVSLKQQDDLIDLYVRRHGGS